MKIPRPSRKSVAFNMTPMIDIVFQLIIFFLVSSHLAQTQNQYELDLPTAKGGESSNEEDDKSPRLIINVIPPQPQSNEYQILLAGEPVDLSQLKQKLLYERKTRPQLEIRIRASQATPYRFIEPILQTCAKAGVWDVKFAVYEK